MSKILFYRSNSVKKLNRSPELFKTQIKAKRIRFIKQINAKMYESMSESEKLDYKLKSQKRWFKMFKDSEVFKQNIMRIHEEFENKVKSDKATNPKARKDSDLWALTQSSQRLDGMAKDNEIEPVQECILEKPKEWFKTQVIELFQKVTQRAPNAIWFDDDWNTDDDNIKYDQTKLRCELLKTLKDTLEQANEESA